MRILSFPRGTVFICGIVGLGVVATPGLATSALAADPDWKAVEQALGKPGQLMPGDVYRTACPAPTST